MVPKLHLDGVYVGAVCLPDPLLNYTASTAWVTGWGLDGAGALQEFLQQAQVLSSEHQTCHTDHTGLWPGYHPARVQRRAGRGQRTGGEV